jgi:hypothetical protein
VVKTFLYITPARAQESGNRWVTAHGLDAHGTSPDDARRPSENTLPSTTLSSSKASDNVFVQLRIRSSKWFVRNVRQVCDGTVGRLGRSRETVRSETAIPSFSNSPWIRGAPQRRFSFLQAANESAKV